jgi:predicted N-formylglutamate amidohydrolase
MKKIYQHMRNNNKHKKYINKIGFERTLQCLIEIVDDSITDQNIVPIWKLRLVESLEQAYDAYMDKDQDILCGANDA